MLRLSCVKRLLPEVSMLEVFLDTVLMSADNCLLLVKQKGNGYGPVSKCLVEDTEQG